MLKSRFYISILYCFAFSSLAEVIPHDKFRNNSAASSTVRKQKNALVVTIYKTARSDSNLAYIISDLPKHCHFRFSADTTSNRGSSGFLAVKLQKNGKDIAYQESPRAGRIFRRLGVDFYTADADRIILMCRMPQNHDMLGVSTIFSNLQLTSDIVENKNQCLELKPGFENCSIYINQYETAVVRYRRQGNKTWQESLPLVYHASDRSMRGSLLKLTEKTVYEFEIKLTDTGKSETLTGNFKTHSSDFPIAKTIELDSNNFKGQLIITESGSEDGYIRYTAKPGTILQGAPNAWQTILVDGIHHIILENLTLRGGRRFGIELTGVNDIVVRNCDIAEFGELGIPDPRSGFKYMQHNEHLRDICAIRIQDSERILIERNYIHDSRAKSCPWFYSHADGAHGIMIRSTSGLTIRYNDIVGSDEYRWTDAISGYGNANITGGVYRDVEIYGNYLAFGNDDGAELDGGQMNCRFYRNKVEGMLCGISTAPCLLGPSYIFENLFCNPGDELGITNYALKNNFSRTKGAGRLHFFNNTIIGNWHGYSNYGGTKEPPSETDYSTVLKAISRNNLFLLNTAGNFLQPDILKLRNDFDYDLFWNTISGQSIKFMKDAGLEVHAITTEPKFINAESADFRLLSDSPGIASGTVIPGLYTNSPNIGAFPVNDSPPLPYRPLDFCPDRNQLNFSWGGNTTTQLTVVTTSEYRGKFHIRQNRTTEFFTVNPQSGSFDGKPVEFTVTLIPHKAKQARLYSGAFMISTPEGYSRPISVRADFRLNRQSVEIARQNVIFGNITPGTKIGEYICDFDLPKTGDYFLFGYLSATTNSVHIKYPNGKFQRVAVMSIKGGLQPRWSSIRSTTNRFATQLPLRCQTGKYRIEIKSDSNIDCNLARIALAESPEPLLYSPFVR